MVARALATMAALAFAVGAFCGAAPTTVSPNPFGFFFIGIAVLVWFAWKSMTGGFDNPGTWDSITKGWLGSHGADQRRKSTS
jgi:hypothetical protein